MIIYIWTRNDGTGLLDEEFRDGDVRAVKLDSEEGTIGNTEKMTSLIVKIPDPPVDLIPTIMDELLKPEWAPGPTLDENVVRRACRYTLNWRNQFSASEIATIEADNVVLADGPTVRGGTVSNGVVSGLFTIDDFRRKG